MQVKQYISSFFGLFLEFKERLPKGWSGANNPQQLE